MSESPRMYRCHYADESEGLWRLWSSLLEWICRYRAVSATAERPLPPICRVEEDVR